MSKARRPVILKPFSWRNKTRKRLEQELLELGSLQLFTFILFFVLLVVFFLMYDVSLCSLPFSRVFLFLFSCFFHCLWVFFRYQSQIWRGAVGETPFNRSRFKISNWEPDTGIIRAGLIVIGNVRLSLG